MNIPFDVVTKNGRVPGSDDAILNAPTIAFDNSDQLTEIAEMIETETQKQYLFGVSIIGGGVVLAFMSIENLLIASTIMIVCVLGTIYVVGEVGRKIDAIRLLEYRRQVLPVAIIEDITPLMKGFGRDKTVFQRANELRGLLKEAGNEVLNVSLYQLLKERTLDKDHALAQWAVNAIKQIYPHGYSDLEHGYNCFTFVFQDPSKDDAINETYMQYQERFQRDWTFIVAVFKIEIGRLRSREWSLRHFGQQYL